MRSSRKTAGYIVAVLLLAFIGFVLYLSFQRYGLWTLLYIPEAAILLMCFYVFIPVLLYFAGYARIRKMFTPSVNHSGEEKKFFTLLVPAHNEERVLPALLESLNRQTYPRENYQVVVVADRCNDKTAEITKNFGAICLERFAEIDSNKQDALRYGMLHFNFSSDFQEGFVCIIDADCEADSNFLREMNQQLTKNSNVVAIQSYRYVKNKFESNITILDAAAEALRNRVFCAPRKWMGASVFINGSGVAFKKTLFEKLLDISGNHLAEDKEWKAYLSERHTKVDYCAPARLAYEAVASQKTFQKQRRRWIGSHMDMIRKHGWKTLSQSIINLNGMQFDFFCSLMQVPRSLLLAFTLLFATLDFIYSPTSFIPHWGWIIVVVGLIFYGVLGLFLAKARPKDYLSVPYFLSLVSGIVKTSFISIIGRGTLKWKATRSDDE